MKNQRQSNVHSPARRERISRNQLTDLLIHDQLITTKAKAKELSRKMDKLVTLAKNGSLSSRRKAAGILRNVNVDENQTALQKLFGPIAKTYEKRNGGYTRVLNIDTRRGDAAKMAVILFTK